MHAQQLYFCLMCARRYPGWPDATPSLAAEEMGSLSVHDVADIIRNSWGCSISTDIRGLHADLSCSTSQGCLPAGDVADVIYRSGARLCMPLASLPGHIGAQDYELEEPPEAASRWVEELAGLACALQDRLRAVPALPERAAIQVPLTCMRGLMYTSFQCSSPDQTHHSRADAVQYGAHYHHIPASPMSQQEASVPD